MLPTVIITITPAQQLIQETEDFFFVFKWGSSIILGCFQLRSTSQITDKSSI